MGDTRREIGEPALNLLPANKAEQGACQADEEKDGENDGEGEQDDATASGAIHAPFGLFGEVVAGLAHLHVCVHACVRVCVHVVAGLAYLRWGQGWSSGEGGGEGGGEGLG